MKPPGGQTVGIMLDSLLRHDGWAIGLIDAPVERLLAPRELPATAWLPLQKAHTFFADPFLIERDGRTFCFFEELSYRDNRGTIAYFDVDDPVLEIRSAIRAPHHLSYPYLLEHEGAVWCIPEAGDSGRITAYAAHDFPGGWREEAVLLDVPGVDPTLFEHEGRWWLFCTDARGGWNSDLHAFHAPGPRGPWRAHAGNPVKRNLAGGRPAGRPFRVDGRLIRPAQNCTRWYGGSTILNEVTELTPSRFAETPVATLEPDPRGPRPHGLHTVNACGARIVVDGNRQRFDTWQAGRAMRGYAKRLGLPVP